MYDAVIVLALKLDQNWKLPDDLEARLDYAWALFLTKQTRRIVVSGKWSIWFDWLGITPPITEAEAMRNYLISKGIPESAVITETKSKDTIGNLVELSNLLDEELFKNISLICAEQHLDRVKFLSESFFDKSKTVTYIPVKSPHFEENTTGKEGDILAEQREVAAEIKYKLERIPGYQLYEHPYYARQARRVQQLIKANPQLKKAKPALAPEIADRLLAQSHGGGGRI